MLCKRLNNVFVQTTASLATVEYLIILAPYSRIVNSGRTELFIYSSVSGRLLGVKKTVINYSCFGLFFLDYGGYLD